MQAKLPRFFYLSFSLLIIIAIVDVLSLDTIIAIPITAKAASQSINTPDMPAGASTATQDHQASPLKDEAHKIMNNAQNWLMGKAGMVIGNTKVTVKNEVKRRIDQQIENIEAPVMKTIETIKKIIYAKYNQAIDAIKKIYEKTLPQFDK